MPEQSPSSPARLACNRCGSADVTVREVADVPRPATSAWPYVDRAVLRCERCCHTWTQVERTQLPAVPQRRA